MKFLECPKLLALTNGLSGTNLGDRVVHGRIESYTCKSVKAEKALSKEIEKQLVVEASTSPGAAQGAAALASPLGPLNSTQTRKLLVNLITTMNASFPDYDFSNLRPEQFEHESSRFVVQSSVNNMLLNGMEQIQPGFRDQCWKTIDEAIELDKCEIYNYIPDMDSDLHQGKLWSFNYFFFNKKKKTLVLFSAYAVSKMRGKNLVVDDDDIDNDMDDDVNADADDNGQPLDWDDLNMDGTAPAKASSSSSTAAAAATGRVGSVPASPFMGAAMSPAQPPMLPGSNGFSQPQTLHLHPQQQPPLHHHQHSHPPQHQPQQQLQHANMYPQHVVPAAAAAPAPAAMAAAAASPSGTILMGPATPQQQQLLHQQLAAHQQHQQQLQLQQMQLLQQQQPQQQQQQQALKARAMSASAPLPIPQAQPQTRPGLIMLHGGPTGRSASIVGQPQAIQSQQSQVRAAAFGTSPAAAGQFVVPQSPQMQAAQQAQAQAQAQAQQQPQQPLLNLNAARTNSFVAAAAVQQNPQLMQQLLGKQIPGTATGQRTPAASPAVSPLIRPAQPVAAGALGIRSASGPAPAAQPAPVARQSSAPQPPAQQQQRSAAALSATLSMLSSTPMSSSTAVAVSQSLGIPLLKPISAQQQQPLRGALAGVRV